MLSESQIDALIIQLNTQLNNLDGWQIRKCYDVPIRNRINQLTMQLYNTIGCNNTNICTK